MTAPSVREVLETKIALAMNEELCRQIDAKESTDTLNVTSKIVALPCIQSLIEGAATAPTPSAAQWRYEVQHGPEGEAYYAWVFNGDNQLVCTTQTRHAKAIVERMNALLPDAAAIRADAVRQYKDAVESVNRSTDREIEAAIRAAAFEEAAGVADCLADEYDATSFTSTNAEQVGALRSKEQAAHEIAAAIRAAGEK